MVHIGTYYDKPIVAIFNKLIYIQFNIYIYVIFFYVFNLIFIFMEYLLNPFNLICLYLFNLTTLYSFDFICLYSFNLIFLYSFNSVRQNIHLILGTGSTHWIRKIRGWEVTNYLGHRIWISSLATAPSWQSRLWLSRGTGHFFIMQSAPCRGPWGYLTGNSG